MKTHRVPLFGYFTTREYSTTKDQRFKNCYPETIRYGDEPKNQIVKRPGLTTHHNTTPKTVTFTNGTNIVNLTSHGYSNTQKLTFTTTGAVPAELVVDTTYYIVSANTNDFQVSLTSGGAAVTFTDDGTGTTTANFVVVGRGMYGWEDTNSLYSVIGNRLYKGTTDLNSGGRFNNSTGIARFNEVRLGTPVIVIQDGNDLWLVNSSNTVTEVVDEDFPATIVPGVAHLDTYTFVMTPDGAIYNSDTNDPTSWSATAFLTAQVAPDEGVGITQHLNYIVAFGKWTVEFFFNAGNASGSVLDPNDGQVIQWGCAEGKTVWSGENTVVWVGRGRDGGKNVMMLNGLSPKIVSDKPIEKLIENEVDLSDCYAFAMRIGGHIHYCLTLKTAAITLAFDLIDKVWWEVSSYDGSTETYFTGVDAASINNQSYILDEDNGKVYHFDVDVYQDDSQIIKTEVVTNPVDFGTNRAKFISRLSLIGDQGTSTDNITIDWTDDDYQNYKTSRTVDMSKSDPHLSALGSHNRGRAYRFKHENNSPMRLSEMEFNLNIGFNS